MLEEEFLFISEKYQIQKFISRGSFSKVYLANEIDSKQLVVIKIIKKNKKTRDRIMRDSAIPNMLCHANIIKIINFIENETYAYIIYPYVNNCISMSKIRTNDLIFNKKPKRKFIAMDCFSGKESNGINKLKYFVEMLCQICDAIEYLHSNFIVHGDIKPQNIIINSDIAILIDFDLSSVTNHPLYFTKKVIFGTPYYLAPEIWRREENISYDLTDIYSFGVTLYYIFNRKKMPYHPITVEDMEYMIRNTDPIPSDSGFPFLDKLIMLMISKDPALRPNISTIKDTLKKLIQ
jgi:serine/threonine protein kinase